MIRFNSEYDIQHSPPSYKSYNINSAVIFHFVNPTIMYSVGYEYSKQSHVTLDPSSLFQKARVLISIIFFSFLFFLLLIRLDRGERYHITSRCFYFYILGQHSLKLLFLVLKTE